MEIEVLRSGLTYEAKPWQGPRFGGRVWVCTRFGWMLGLGTNGDKLVITQSKFRIYFPTLGQRYFICMSGNLFDLNSTCHIERKIIWWSHIVVHFKK